MFCTRNILLKVVLISVGNENKEIVLVVCSPKYSFSGHSTHILELYTYIIEQKNLRIRITELLIELVSEHDNVITIYLLDITL